MTFSDVDSSSHVELRVYEKHRFGTKRVGTLKYDVSIATNGPETILGEHSMGYKSDRAIVLISIT